MYRLYDSFSRHTLSQWDRVAQWFIASTPVATRQHTEQDDELSPFAADIRRNAEFDEPIVYTQRHNHYGIEPVGGREWSPPTNEVASPVKTNYQICSKLISSTAFGINPISTKYFTLNSADFARAHSEQQLRRASNRQRTFSVDATTQTESSDDTSDNCSPVSSSRSSAELGHKSTIGTQADANTKPRESFYDVVQRMRQYQPPLPVTPKLLEDQKNFQRLMSTTDCELLIHTMRENLQHYDWQEAAFVANQIISMKAAPSELRATAQFTLAQLIATNRVNSLSKQKPMQCAVDLWTAAADAGHSASAYQLGVVYLRGADAITKDTAKGRHWMQVAAELGSSHAQQYRQK